jgi:hypothetical protein
MEIGKKNRFCETFYVKERIPILYYLKMEIGKNSSTI